MPGLGALGGIAKKLGGEALETAKDTAVQQAGAQLGAQVGNAPFALLHKLGSIEKFVQSPNSFGGTPIDGWFPAFSHTIFVGVQGGPDASLKRIWQLAVSAAFGRLRQRIATFAGVQVECIWDVTEKAVGMRISYGSNGLIPVILAGLGINGESAVEIIQRGPSSETVGGNWAGFLKTYGQLLGKGGDNKGAMGGRMTPVNTAQNDEAGIIISRPNTYRSGTLRRDNAFEPDNSKLPDDGRIITTSAYADPNVQPPRPTDYSNIIGIVSNALTAPCYLPCKPKPGLQVENPTGVRVYSAGNTDLQDRYEVVTQAENWASATNSVPLPLGVDGTPRPTKDTVPEVPDECSTEPRSSP